MGSAISVAVGLMIGNFIYQFFKGRDWSKAMELSWFQTVAIFAYWLNLQW